MRVLFNDPKEWLDEVDLDLEGNQVDPMIARVCVQLRATSFLQLVSVHVAASYLARGHVVFLDVHMGNALAGDISKTSEGQAADVLIRRLTRTLREKGFDVRGGILDNQPAAPDTTGKDGACSA